MNGLLEALIALGYGLISAMVPLVNAEAFAVVAGARGSHAGVIVLGLALGQTAGKPLLFETRQPTLVVRRDRQWRAVYRPALPDSSSTTNT